jgi:1-acyl-sn-glycerol-3-phosphate acyltransferase
VTPPGKLHRIPIRGRIVWRLAAPAVRLYARRRWKLDVERTAPLPAGGYVLTGNHPSSIDPVLVAAIHGRSMPFLAVDVLYGSYRSLDLALRWFGALPVARGGVPLAAMRIALDHLRAGGVLGVFPEGTRAPEWGSHEVRLGAAWLAVRSGTPIVPVAVVGSADAFTMELTFGPGPVRLVVGPPLYPDGTDRAAVEALSARWVDWMTTVLRP